MRNPDKWQPPEPGQHGPPSSRRAALIGLIVIALLVGGGVLLTRMLGGMAQFQDCILSGRAGCH